MIRTTLCSQIFPSVFAKYNDNWPFKNKKHVQNRTHTNWTSLETKSTHWRSKPKANYVDILANWWSSEEENNYIHVEWIYLIGGVEFVVHEASDDAGLPDGLIAQEHQLVFRQRWYHRHWTLFLSTFETTNNRSESNPLFSRMQREREREKEGEREIRKREKDDGWKKGRNDKWFWFQPIYLFLVLGEETANLSLVEAGKSRGILFPHTIYLSAHPALKYAPSVLIYWSLLGMSNGRVRKKISKNVRQKKINISDSFWCLDPPHQSESQSLILLLPNIFEKNFSSILLFSFGNSNILGEISLLHLSYLFFSFYSKHHHCIYNYFRNTPIRVNSLLFN